MSFETKSYIAMLSSFALLIVLIKYGIIGPVFAHFVSGSLALYGYAAGLYSYFKLEGRIFGCIALLVSFMVFICMYGNAYRSYEFNTIEGVRSITFGEGIYFSIVTTTTLGYGDFSPIGDVRYLAASQALIGYLFLGTFIGVFLDFGAQIRNQSDGQR